MGGMPVSVLKERISVLGGLMVIQSLSGMILARFEDMIQKHVVVTLFLTMLVGAGGNAGNQSTVNIIRGLATGQVNTSNYSSVVLVESKLGIVLGIVLATLAWARVMITSGDAVSAMAIGASVLCIVAISTVVGAVLPIVLHRSLYRRSACRARHPGADGHRRSVDHMHHLRPALHLLWSTVDG